MKLWKELRDAIMEVQYVLHDDTEPFPRSKANLLCEGMIKMVNQFQHEPTAFTGWAPWRQAVYAQLEQPMPSRNHMKNARRGWNSHEI